MEKKISLKDRIFIAGASGMAGSAIKRKLIKYGYGNIKIGGALLTPSRKDLDLLNNSEIENWFITQKPDVVIIAAAEVGGIYANLSKPTNFILNNLKIQTNLIETAWKFKVKRLLFLGSSCIYPKLAKQPIKEDYLLNGPLEETNQWYAIAKIAGIKLCQALREEHKFDALTLMPTNLYGPGDNYDINNSHVMASLIKKFFNAKKNNLTHVTCWGDGNPYREFMHVDDLGEAVVFALENWDPEAEDSPKDDMGGKLSFLNVGTGKDISIRELATKIAKATNYTGKIIWDKNKPNGTPKKQLNIERINKLGWKARISLDSGIEETISNFELEQNNLQIKK